MQFKRIFEYYFFKYLSFQKTECYLPLLPTTIKSLKQAQKIAIFKGIYSWVYICRIVRGVIFGGAYI